MDANRWYDRFAPIYDIGTFGDFFYRRARRAAVERLELSPGSGVADIFCGTGVDFPPLRKRIGEAGHILAVDGSAGMLEQAETRAEALGLRETAVAFLRADLSRSKGIETVAASIRDRRLRHLFFSLGLTCLENWREVCSRFLDAAVSGTRVAILDVHARRFGGIARVLNWIGAADVRRPVWRVVEERCTSFAWKEFRPFGVRHVPVFVASGTKP